MSRPPVQTEEGSKHAKTEKRRQALEYKARRRYPRKAGAVLQRNRTE